MPKEIPNAVSLPCSDDIVTFQTYTSNSIFTSQIRFCSSIEQIHESFVSDAVIVIDAQVAKLYQDKLLEKLPITLTERIYTIEALEKHKTLSTINKLYRFFSDCAVTRSTTIYAVGGGIVTDLTAYAASTYKRGCRLSLIPTTLIGMVDAALGGKTGCNYNSYKNHIGSFYPANEIIIYPQFLQTLPLLDLQSGVAEMLKLWFIMPEHRLPEPSAKIPDIELLTQYISVKMEFSCSDLQDKGNRRLLNLGHTFGHVLETVSNFRYPHGHCVAWGMATTARLSEKMGLISSNICHKIIGKIIQFGYFTELDKSLLTKLYQRLVPIIRQDKKSSSELNLVCFTGWHEVAVKPVLQEYFINCDWIR